MTKTKTLPPQTCATEGAADDRVERMRLAFADLAHTIESTAAWLDSTGASAADRELAAFRDELAACALRIQGQLQMLDDNVWVIDDEAWPAPTPPVN